MAYEFTYNIDQKTINELDDIVVKKTEDCENAIFNENNKSITTRLSSTMSETSRKIVGIAKTFFENTGLLVDQNDGYITYVSYEYNSPKYIDYDDWVENIYCSNETYINVHECIIVTRKDENLKDGNMEVYKNNPNTFLNMIGYEKEEKDVYDLNTGTVMVFNGDTIYKLQTFSGKGIFNFIVITLKDIQDIQDI
jgi:hypothetical protein